jgi:hypothetical protein
MDALEKGLPWTETPYYVVGQVLGGVTGAAVAHLMFVLPAISLTRHTRSGPPQVFSEFVATFGLHQFLPLIRGRHFVGDGEIQVTIFGQNNERGTTPHAFET